MSGGQGKIFSILGPKLRGSKAQQYYRDKLLQIRVEMTDNKCFLKMLLFRNVEGN